jgi:hypothetical protein
MSYELSGLGASPPPWSKIHRIKGSKLPHPKALRQTVPGVSVMKRRASPGEIMRWQPRLPISVVVPSQLTGLGFSLKPPKFIRKLTIKKVLKPLAIAAAVVGTAFIPGALPLVGKAVGLLAKGAIGAGRFAVTKLAKPIGGGFMSVFKKNPAAPAAETPAGPTPPAPDTSNAPQEPRNTTPSGTPEPSAPVPYSPPTYAPDAGDSSGGGGGGYSSAAPVAAEAPQEAPAAAGMNASSLIPIGVGLVALVAVSGALKRRRR